MDTYEKKYNEALERAKELLLGNEHSNTIRSYFEHIFPELRESEDERIRKWLIKTIHLIGVDKDICADQETMDKAIAWLEKHKEPFVSMNPALGFDSGGVSVYHESEDERMIRKIESFLSAYGGDYFSNDEWREIEVWLEKQKDLHFDYPGLYFYDGEKLHFQGNPATEDNPYDFAMSQQKEQKPLEWSEEETKDLVHILKVLDDCYVYGKHDLSKTDHDNLTSTIKSLRPSWKPTEEQMDALQHAIDACESEWVYRDDELRSLLNDLKKL